MKIKNLLVSSLLLGVIAVGGLNVNVQAENLETENTATLDYDWENMKFSDVTGITYWEEEFNGGLRVVKPGEVITTYVGIDYSGENDLPQELLTIFSDVEWVTFSQGMKISNTQIAYSVTITVPENAEGLLYFKTIAGGHTNEHFSFNPKILVNTLKVEIPWTDLEPSTPVDPIDPDMTVDPEIDEGMNVDPGEQVDPDLDGDMTVDPEIDEGMNVDPGEQVEPEVPDTENPENPENPDIEKPDAEKPGKPDVPELDKPETPEKTPDKPETPEKPELTPEKTPEIKEVKVEAKKDEAKTILPDSNPIVIKSEIEKVLDAKEELEKAKELPATGTKQGITFMAVGFTILFFVLVFYAAKTEKKFENKK